MAATSPTPTCATRRTSPYRPATSTLDAEPSAAGGPSTPPSSTSTTEIHPYVPDAWIDHAKTKIGYEIPFTRQFYVYTPPRPVAEIRAEIDALERADPGTHGRPRVRNVPLRRVARLSVAPSTERRPLLTLEAIEGGTGRIVGETPESSPEGQVAYEPGDVLFSKLRPYLSKSVLVNEPMHGTGELLAIRPGDALDQKFLFYVTLSTGWVEHSTRTAYGLKMPRTSWDALADYRLRVPPCEEQRRITDFLDDQVTRIDEIVALRERQRLEFQ